MGYIFKSLNINKIKEVFEGKFKVIKDRVISLRNERLLEKLRSGHFENIEINISDLFKHQKYEYLNALAEGCAFNGNSDLLCQMFTFFMEKLDYPDAAKLYPTRESAICALRNGEFYGTSYANVNLDNHTYQSLIGELNRQISWSGGSVMSHLIDSALVLEDTDDRCKKLLSTFPNNEKSGIYLRMHCIDLYKKEFASRWQNYSEAEKFNILALELALNNEIITYEMFLSLSDGERIVSFKGLPFKNGVTSSFELPSYAQLRSGWSKDAPICALEQKMLAEFLYQKIKDKSILLDDDAQDVDCVNVTYRKAKSNRL